MKLCRIFEGVVVCVDFNIPIASPVVAILNAGWLEEELPTVIDPIHLVRTKQVESSGYWNLKSELTVPIDPDLSRRLGR
jgi:hypothetical protein